MTTRSFASWVATVVALAGCNSEPSAIALPEGFLIGTSTAGFQVDMGCPTLPASQCVDANSDWYQFVTSPDTIALSHTHLVGEDPAVVGPGHWELYEHDFDLAQADGHTVFRMSLEWSRIFPTSTVGIEGFDPLHAIANPDALAHYHAVFAALRARGLEPYVTLNHYSLPSWIHDGLGCTLDFDHCTARGWADPATIVPEIAKYAGFVAREFGGEVDLWATENEPFAIVLPGYVMPSETRSNPPAQNLLPAAAKIVFNALIDAHARMYDAIHAADTVDASGHGVAANVGLVYAMAPVAPQDPSNPKDVKAAENVFYLWNMAFLNAVVGGVLDANLDGNGVPRADLANRMDHLGINYYVRPTIQGTDGPVLPDLSPLTTFNPFTLTQDQVYPRGMYELVMFVHEQFDLPMFITENDGQAIPRGDVDAEQGALVETLQWLARAANEGADVRGYMYWSLIDNYEWNHGTTLPFGLYQVDPHDPQKTRVPRPTAQLLARIAKGHAIAGDLVGRYPIGD
ncbi:MAG: putative glycoside hydrolase family protein [Deltaproteobacteria bacterium]|nr:putative glycoside hydrolase family protein [Deltaproteobacteria bacterium]